MADALVIHPYLVISFLKSPRPASLWFRTLFWVGLKKSLNNNNSKWGFSALLKSITQHTTIWNIISFIFRSSRKAAPVAKNKCMLTKYENKSFIRLGGDFKFDLDWQGATQNKIDGPKLWHSRHQHSHELHHSSAGNNGLGHTMIWILGIKAPWIRQYLMSNLVKCSAESTSCIRTSLKYE